MVGQVAKIAILDIRLANTDRNGSNILVSYDADGAVRLTPIDHGYCLPSSLQDITFEWLYWPQARASFTDDALAYIRSLDADADLALLDAHGLHIRPECARVFRVSRWVPQSPIASWRPRHPQRQRHPQPLGLVL